uniref:cytochrome c oxidase subunit II n=1 Tax=Tetraonchus monenteron TaxID=198446 RepID=UPI0014366D7C|nr:cytochrome c oxidase subunit II [Tetraonchus monenteron]QIH29917.1 cytochrome c oxidase subunit 2 [Tetraonchus monenteron]
MNLNCIYLEIVSYISTLCVFITVGIIFYLIWAFSFVSGVYKVDSENSLVEFLWTLIPSFWVLNLCFLNVGYITKDLEGLAIDSIKIVGRQWYWSYEYLGLNYDSYMTSLVNNVDKPLQLCYGSPSRLLITSSDVIHSFSVPDLGIKMDAIPGRINQVVCVPERVGVFVGYCSELCGAGHSYMPIVVEVVNLNYCS